MAFQGARGVVKIEEPRFQAHEAPGRTGCQFFFLLIRSGLYLAYRGVA